MTHSNSRVLSLVVAAISVTALAGERSRDAWQQSATLYLWLPDINGTTRFAVPPSSGSSVSVDASKNRRLRYDQGDDKFLQDFAFGGPMLGVRFHF